MCGLWTGKKERKKERLDPSKKRGFIKKETNFREKKI